MAHLELSREVVRRFNQYFKPIFPEPKGLLTKTRRLPGLDGRKMSKSFDNAVYLGEEDKAVKDKIMRAPTDPQRVRRNDPGNPEVCNIFAYQKLFQNEGTVAEIDTGCRTAAIGCVDCKKRLLVELEAFRAPLREKRLRVLQGTTVDDIIDAGNKQARAVAQETMAEVREAMRLC